MIGRPTGRANVEHVPSIVSWNVTSACNLHCPHCYLDAGRRRIDELSTAECLAVVDELAAAGTELLILTGGEPLLRKDLPALANRASKLGMSVVLGTTGTLIDRRRASVLKSSGVTAVGVSLDSLDAAKHDAFRGLPGAWRRAVAGIAACRDEGLDVLIHVTALRMNQQEIPALVQFAHEQGARVCQLFFLICTGRGEHLTDLSPEEYESLLVWVLEAQGRYPGMMVRARCAPYIGRLARQRSANLFWSAGCLAGTRYCRITPSGDVTPCPYLPTVVGNVRSDGFRAIWRSSPELVRLRAPRLGGKCGRCRFSQGDDPVCVGCRARALALTGDALAADPWCLYEPEQGPGAPGPETTDASPPREEPVGQVVLAWTDEAQARLGRVPSYMRGRVRQIAEAYARRQGLGEVTPCVLDVLRQWAPPAPRASGSGNRGVLPGCPASRRDSLDTSP